MDKIADYSIFLEKLMVQWKDSPNLVGIIEASMVQANKMEDAIFEVQDLMNLDSATGVQLELLGEPWDVYRDNRTDTEYRAAIQQKKLQQFSGEPESIISIMKGSYSGSYVVYSPEYPGKYRVRSDSTIVLSELQEISMAGVQGFLSGFIIDALGNNIVDANGNRLIHVAG